MALRGSKGVLRGPSCPFVDQKVFFVPLRGPSWIKRCSPRPFVALRGSRRCSSCPFVALRGLKGVLRGPSWPFVDKKVFFAAFRGPSWIQKVFFVPLRGPSWIKRCSSCPFVALRGQKGVLLDSPKLRRVSFACLSASSWINLPFQPARKGSAKQPSTERPPSRKSQEILQILLKTTSTRNPETDPPQDPRLTISTIIYIIGHVGWPCCINSFFAEMSSCRVARRVGEQCLGRIESDGQC